MLNLPLKQRVTIPRLSPQRNEEVLRSVDEVTRFHGRKAPGAIIAAYMVDLALECLPETHGRLNAIAETRVCLADAIQVMTGLTLGNKYLHVKDYGRWALTLYERESSQGFRVCVDPSKVDPEQLPILDGFFRGTRDYSQTPRSIQQQQVTQEFMKLKRDLFALFQVHVDLPPKPPLYALRLCEHCQEYHRPTPEHPVCLCQSEKGLYTVLYTTP